jgi:hypothetical protein
VGGERLRGSEESSRSSTLKRAAKKKAIQRKIDISIKEHLQKMTGARLQQQHFLNPHHIHPHPQVSLPIIIP